MTKADRDKAELYTHLVGRGRLSKKDPIKAAMLAFVAGLRAARKERRG